MKESEAVQTTDLSLFLSDEVLQDLTHGVVVLNRYAKIVVWNRWMTKMSGLEMQQVQGRELTDLFPALAQTRICSAIQEALLHHWSAIISQRIGNSPFPLFVLRKRQRIPIEQLIAIKPLLVGENPENLFCVIEVTDVSSASSREMILRQQSRELQALIELSQENEMRLGTMLASALDGILTFDRRGVILTANPAVRKIFGYTEQELIKQHVSLILPEANFGVFQPKLNHLFWVGKNKSGNIREVTGCKKNGMHTPLDISISEMTIGTNLSYMVIIRDISQRKKDEQIMRLMKFSLEHISEGAFWINEEGQILRVNRAACRMLGYSHEELLNMYIHEVDIDYNKEDWRAFWEELKLRHAFTFETHQRHKDGMIVPIDMSVNFLEFDGLEYNLAFARDLSERKRTEHLIHQLLFYDALTQLPNRKMLREHVQKMIETRMHHTPPPLFGLIFLDLDRFKAINDNLGQSGGDELLKAVSRRIRNSIRENDFLARLGGDEFSIILTNISNIEGAARCAEKLIEQFKDPFVIHHKKVYVSPSLGISVYPSDADDIDNLMQFADNALYRAKASGRNTYRYYTPEMGTFSAERLMFESELRQAIERHDLFLAYQPQLDLATNSICGVEALIRWKHPTLGIVSPARFIPVAEETGLIVSIGEWVLRTACEQNKKWQEMGLKPVRVAVNLSALQFRQKDLLSLIERVLDETQLDPQWLELELTESIIMENAEKTINTLKRLEKMGMQLSIDDFGTGYSSLNYLKRFPIHRIKIDRSFITDILKDNDDVAITQAIIALSKSLRLGVIAEGVETNEQLEFLRQLGCDEIQGFFYSKPILPEQLVDFLKY